MKIRIHRKKRSGGEQAVFAAAGILTCMLLLAMRIPLGGVIGDAGMGLFAPAFEIFFAAEIMFSYGISRSVSGLIRYRVKREQYRNARRVFTAALWLCVVLGGVMAALLFLLADGIAVKVSLEAFSRLAIMAAAPAVFLTAVIGALRGCFGGFGLGKTVLYSQYLEKGLFVLLTIVCGRSFRVYGEKTATLLRRDAYTYLYSALGAMVGICAAEVITLLFLLVVYAMYAGTIRRLCAQDSGRRAESTAALARTILWSSLPVIFMTVVPNLLLLFDQRMFNYSMNRSELGESRTALWGVCYGKGIALPGVFAALVCLGLQSHVARIAAACEKEEYHTMRERMDRAVRKAGMLTFPVAIYHAVLAEPFAKLLFHTETEYAAQIVRTGALVVAAFAFSFLNGQLLLRLRLFREGMLATLVAFVVHILAAYLLVQKGSMGAQGVTLSLAVFYGVYLALAFVLLNRFKQCRIDWLRSAAFPAVASGVSGLVALLLSRLLLGSAGALVTLLVCILIGIIVDILLLMILRVVTEEELSRTWFGLFFITLGRQLRIF